MHHYFFRATQRTWIGLTDVEREGELVWVNNDTMKFSHFGPGEPPAKHDTFDCVFMRTNGPWRMGPCSYNCEYLCSSVGKQSGVTK